jgi:2-dehydropantoate 2-reductase
MRFVVFGAGAVGGVVAARLHQAGRPVAVIARGAHYEAIRDRGLILEEPDGATVLDIEAADAPGGLRWDSDDVVLLAVKSQDTAGALSALRDATARCTAIVCLQNGVENERAALRLFERVYGAVVMVPAAHLAPGVVQSHATRLTGIVDLGRYPSGCDECAERISAALADARFSSRVCDEVMRLKYAKLLLNLGNAVDAMFAEGKDAERLAGAAREEGRTVLSTAGIAHEADEVANVGERWDRMGVRRDRRAGSSTWQSLRRGTGAIETDYLNGEIVLLGRLHHAATPVNEALCRAAAHAACEGVAPRSLSAAGLLSEIEEREGAWTR